MKSIKTLETQFISMKKKIFQALEISDKEYLINNINPKNIIDLTTIIMAIVDKNSKNLSGSDKKQMTLNIIYDIIEHSNISLEYKSYILDIVNNIYDGFVENIINVSKGKYNINTTKVKKIFNFFLSCIKRKILF